VSFLVTHQKPKVFDREKLMNVALRALGMRAHSIGELRDKLRRRGTPEDVEAVMASLKDAGYLDDRRFAENFAATRLGSQLGKMRVIRDLRQRRVAPQLAEQVTEAAYRDTDEASLIAEFLGRKYRGKDMAAFLVDEKNVSSVYRRLRYAGFSAGASISALKRHARAAEALEDLESGNPGEAEE
jgi:regulatory protein